MTRGRCDGQCLLFPPSCLSSLLHPHCSFLPTHPILIPDLFSFFIAALTASCFHTHHSLHHSTHSKHISTKTPMLTLPLPQSCHTPPASSIIVLSTFPPSIHQQHN